MIKNYVNIFHIFIIALLLSFINGCGHKKPPYYPDQKANGKGLKRSVNEV